MESHNEQFRRPYFIKTHVYNKILEFDKAQMSREVVMSKGCITI